MVSNEMARKRPYRQKKRAERLAETRQRITEVTVDLHRSVGPAATTISEVARRAGVQRMTVYNHFPDEATLFAACSSHWRALHPTPDVTLWAFIDDPSDRLRRALEELYAWYRQTEPMTANVLRDAEVLPALRPILENGLLRYLERARGVLGDAFEGCGGPRERIDAAVRAATDFHLWRCLAPLGDREAAVIACALVEAACEG